MRHAIRYGAMAFAAVALLGAGVAVAQDKTAAVKDRQDIMKSNGQVVYRLVPGYLRNGQGTPEEIAKGAATIVENLKKVGPLFVAGTSTTDLAANATKAKPEIWQNLPDFQAKAQKAAELAAGLETAAKTGDKDKISEAYTSLNRDGCTACHNQYRVEQPRGG
jgi:cytochrome c556